MSDPVRATLRATGLLPVAERAKLRLSRARKIYGADVRSVLRPVSAPDGLPIPPARLRYFAVGSTDVAGFLDGGRRVAQMIEETLGRNEIDMNGLGAMLDFGVGCGRVARYWKKLEGVGVFGTDYNGDAVAWCSRNLTFGTFTTKDRKSTRLNSSHRL